MIQQVLRYYFPDWEPPPDRYKWNRCLCPAHDEDTPSCAVSYALDAVNCLACGFRGDSIAIISRKEGMSRRQAYRFAETVFEGSDHPVRQQSRRKHGGRAPSFPRSYGERKD